MQEVKLFLGGGTKAVTEHTDLDAKSTVSRGGHFDWTGRGGLQRERIQQQLDEAFVTLGMTHFFDELTAMHDSTRSQATSWTTRREEEGWLKPTHRENDGFLTHQGLQVGLTDHEATTHLESLSEEDLHMTH